jgi:hypothetical protein
VLCQQPVKGAGRTHLEVWFSLISQAQRRYTCVLFLSKLLIVAMGKRIIPPQDPARLKLVMDEKARMFGVGEARHPAPGTS